MASIAKVTPWLVPLVSDILYIYTSREEDAEAGRVSVPCEMRKGKRFCYFHISDYVKADYIRF